MFTIECDQNSLLDKLDQFVTKNISVIDTPLIKVKPNLVTVGPYRVVTDGEFFKLYQDSLNICDFLKRSWAVGYALCLIKSNKEIAEDIVFSNQKYDKLHEDRSFYHYHIRRNIRTRNFDRVLMFENRLSRTDSEIFNLENVLRRKLKSLSF